MNNEAEMTEAADISRSGISLRMAFNLLLGGILVIGVASFIGEHVGFPVLNKLQWTLLTAFMLSTFVWWGLAAFGVQGRIREAVKNVTSVSMILTIATIPVVLLIEQITVAELFNDFTVIFMR